MVVLITITVLYLIFKLGQFCFNQAKRIEDQKQLIKNMDKWDKEKNKEFLADMDAQDPKWGKHKI